MSIVIQIPPGSIFLQPVKRFQALFNNPTVNKYDFGTPANTDIDFQDTKKQHLYLFDKFSFSASMDEGLFLENVDTVNGEPSTKLSIKVPTQHDRLIYNNKIPIINYIDNSDVIFFAYTDQIDTLTISMEGTLEQSVELVGKPSVFAQVTCNCYEIRNKKWIEHFLGRTYKGQAVGLLNGSIQGF